MKKLAISVLLLSACATQPRSADPCRAGLPILNATLWIQSSAEYKAAATQTYQVARTRIDARLHESTRPAAVILDADETAIENMDFETRMIREDKTYDTAAWTKWINESAARAVPGAGEFLAYAKSRGVTPFIITNRKVVEKPGTLANLQRLGYPVTAETLLVRGERPEWESRDKTPRRDYVASQYRVLLVLGDDLNDFTNAQGLTVEQRDARIRETAAHWGNDWLILPNPVYGSWEDAITGEGKTECEELRAKLEALR
jgi:acid phosphatase